MVGSNLFLNIPHYNSSGFAEKKDELLYECGHKLTMENSENNALPTLSFFEYYVKKKPHQINENNLNKIIHNYYQDNNDYNWKEFM